MNRYTRAEKPPNTKKLMVIAGALVAAQAIGIAMRGPRTGPFFSDFIQFALGAICIVECLRAFQRSRGIARYAWRLLAVTFIVWCFAQGIAVYEDISGDFSLDNLDNNIFFLSVIPFGMLPLLDPEGEPNDFDKLHILDFVQVCIFWVSIFLLFSPEMRVPQTVPGVGYLTWSRSIAFDGLLASTFILRAFITRSKSVRSLFARMAMFLVLSSVADSYALSPIRAIQPGGWFDMIWSFLLIVPIAIAATWNNSDEAEVNATQRSHAVVVHQVFPLLYPLLSFFILIRVERAYPLLGRTVLVLAIVSFALRMLFIQYRQLQSEEALLLDVAERKRAQEALRESEMQYRFLFNSNPIPMWVFDTKTLKFLAVNESAIRQYGFSENEFLSMTIADIRPQEDIPRLLEATAHPICGLQEASLWRHRRKNGSVIDVEIVSHDLQFHGIAAELVAAHDISERKRSEELLQNSENKYRALFEDSADATCLLAENGLLDCNLAALQLFGYPPETRGLHPTDLSPPSQPDGTPSRTAAKQKMAAAFRNGKERFEWLHLRPNGETFLAEVCLTALSLSGQKRLLATVRDVTERQQAVDALLFKTALLEAQAETTIDGILAVDEFDKIVLTNKQFARQFGIPDELLAPGNDLLVRRHIIDQVEDPEGFVEKVNLLYRSRDEKSRDEIRIKTGKVFDRYSAPLVDSRGQYRGRIWYFRDITARKQVEKRVQYLAYYDSLTGLPNRTLLRDRLEKALANARRRREKVALLFLDLDGFKHINDSLGHTVGDLLLQEVAARLREYGREQDTIARLGGDEFLVMLIDIKGIPEAAIAAERLMDAMSAEFVVQGRSLNVGCSIGISIFPEHGADAEALIANADAAMYRAKDYGRNNCQFFTAEMNAQAMERLTLENGLRLALEKKQLHLMYQPQLDLASGKIIGLEALLRWEHPELGSVPPDKFIPIAENSGLIVQFGEWVLRTACQQARVWQEEGFPAIQLAVNVSAVQFRQEGFCSLVEKVLRDSGLSPGHLELELTESILIANADLILPVVHQLRAMGVSLAIDDFGTGYSSFSYLKQFHASKLKIDSSFIRDVAINPDDAAITTAIISMAKSLNLTVIAEGVETDAQTSFLKTHQCDQIQGYYFSKPVPLDKIGEILQANQLAPWIGSLQDGSPHEKPGEKPNRTNLAKTAKRGS